MVFLDARDDDAPVDAPVDTTAARHLVDIFAGVDVMPVVVTKGGRMNRERMLDVAWAVAFILLGFLLSWR